MTSVFPSGHFQMRSTVLVYGNVVYSYNIGPMEDMSSNKAKSDKKARMQTTLDHFRHCRRGPGALELCLAPELLSSSRSTQQNQDFLSGLGDAGDLPRPVLQPH